MNKFKIIIIFLTLFLISALDSYSTTFKMAINVPPKTFYYEWFNKICNEIFERLHMDWEIIYLPATRASVETDNGFRDGEVARISSYSDFYTNLIKVDEPIVTMTVLGYSYDSKINNLNGWDSLKNTNLKVEYRRGMKISETKLKEFVQEKNLFSVDSADTGIRTLLAKRVQLYIDDKYSVESILEPYQKKQLFIVGIMDKTPLYMHVHKKNKDLIPEFKRIILELKNEGLIEKFKLQSLEALQ